MMKKVLLIICMLLLSISCFFVGCKDESKTVELVDFENITIEASLNKNFSLAGYLIIEDSLGEIYDNATIVVKDAEGNEETLLFNAFTPDAIGVYTATVTIEINGETFTRTITINVEDRAAPNIIMGDYSPAGALGEPYFFPEIVVNKTSGEEITPVIKVFYNDEEVTEGVETDKFTPSELGEYVIKISATDKFGTTTETSYTITVIKAMASNMLEDFDRPESTANAQFNGAGDCLGSNSWWPGEYLETYQGATGVMKFNAVDNSSYSTPYKKQAVIRFNRDRHQLEEIMESLVSITFKFYSEQAYWMVTPSSSGTVLAENTWHEVTVDRFDLLAQFGTGEAAVNAFIDAACNTGSGYTRLFNVEKNKAFYIDCVMFTSGVVEEPTHTHVECPTCGLCTDANCDGEASEKCQGHQPAIVPPSVAITKPTNLLQNFNTEATESDVRYNGSQSCLNSETWAYGEWVENFGGATGAMKFAAVSNSGFATAYKKQAVIRFNQSSTDLESLVPTIDKVIIKFYSATNYWMVTPSSTGKVLTGNQWHDVEIKMSDILAQFEGSTDAEKIAAFIAVANNEGSGYSRLFNVENNKEFYIAYIAYTIIVPTTPDPANLLQGFATEQTKTDVQYNGAGACDGSGSGSWWPGEWQETFEGQRGVMKFAEIDNSSYSTAYKKQAVIRFSDYTKAQLEELVSTIDKITIRFYSENAYWMVNPTSKNLAAGGVVLAANQWHDVEINMSDILAQFDGETTEDKISAFATVACNEGSGYSRLFNVEKDKAFYIAYISYTLAEV